jgi:gas vesicle protein
LSKNQQFLAGLLLGAAAGAAIALFLQSEKGKELMKEAREGADDLQAGLKERMSAFDEAMTELLNKGKAMVEAMEQKVKSQEHEQSV